MRRAAYLDDVADALARGAPKHDHPATDLQSPLFAAPADAGARSSSIYVFPELSNVR